MSSKKLWAISDLHLSISCPEKDMQIFGPNWNNYQERISSHWQDLIKPQDTVIIAGDISWALQLDKALIDLNWLDKLPGNKILLKGNHDPWWPTQKKWKTFIPSSMQGLYIEPIMWEGFCIGGTRLWDHPTIMCPEIVAWNDTPPKPVPYSEHDEKIFSKELTRLELTLKKMPKKNLKIICTHYPPIHPFFEQDSPCSQLLEKYEVTKVLFGHIHNLKPNLDSIFGCHNGIEYIFTAADHINFCPMHILTA